MLFMFWRTPSRLGFCLYDLLFALGEVLYRVARSRHDLSVSNSIADWRKDISETTQLAEIEPVVFARWTASVGLRIEYHQGVFQLAKNEPFSLENEALLLYQDIRQMLADAETGGEFKTWLATESILAQMILYIVRKTHDDSIDEVYEPIEEELSDEQLEGEL
jgi:hypothetical protein